MNLAEDLPIVGSGAFGDNQSLLAWTQAIEHWQGLHSLSDGEITINGETLTIKVNDLVIIPPGSRCETRWHGSTPYVYNFFSFRPADSGTMRMVPQVVGLGGTGDFWNIEFRKGLSESRSTKAYVNSVARAMLWSVSRPVELVRRNPVVGLAEKIIEDRLSEGLKVAALARELGISVSQLGRLFLLEHGITPKQFIQLVQARKAEELLTTSTLTIKQVAAQCGFGDLHQLNRFARLRLGGSPRAIRAGNIPKDIFRIEQYKRSLDGETG